MRLPVKRVIYREQPFCAKHAEALLRYLAFEAIARVSLIVRRNFVLGLKKRNLQDEMAFRLEHSKELLHDLFGVLHMLQDSDAQYRIEVVVRNGNDVERRIDLDIGALVPFPCEVLVDELTINEVRNLPSSGTRVQDSSF